MNVLLANIEPAVPLRRWRVRTEGPFALLDGTGREISPLGRKSRAIIVYLIAHSDVRVPRERLITLLWGDRGQQQARNSFRQSLAEIRRACGSLVNSSREQVWIDEAVIVRDSTPGAGEFAEDLNHITPEFDDWLSSTRRQQANETWNRLHGEVEGLLDAGRGAHAMSLIGRLQNIDPYNEDWLRLAMRAEAQAGHPAGIERVYRQMADCLQNELGVAPSASSRALHDQLIAELTDPGSGNPESEASAEMPQQDAGQTALQPATTERSAISRRVLVGGALSGVAVVSAGTSLWLRNSEPSRSPAALEYYRRGIELRGQASLSQAEQSVAYLREATRIDPDFGEAWGALAWGYRSLLEYGPRPNPERTVMLARTAASRALEINPRNSQALAALLLLKPIYGNWREIEAGCRRLLKDDAAHSLLQFNLAMTLTEVGRWRDALPILSDLARREPFWPLVYARLFCALMASGRLEEADDLLDAAIKKWPRRIDFWFMKGRHLLETGRLQEALAFAMDPAKRPAENDRAIQIELTLLNAFANASAGSKRAAVGQLADHARADALYLPIIAVAINLIGDVTTAIEMLEGYYFARGPWSSVHYNRPMTSILFVSTTSALRRHPRFDILLRDTGLERYWSETKSAPDYRLFV